MPLSISIFHISISILYKKKYITNIKFKIIINSTIYNLIFTSFFTNDRVFGVSIGGNVNILPDFP